MGSLRAPLIMAALLSATGLGVGFLADDAYHLLMIEGEKTPATDGRLYTFAVGDPAVMEPFIQTGPYPWWTSPDLKIVFCRPLSGALLRIDHALFGRSAVLWHLHSLAWYLLLVLAWALLSRRVLSGHVAALAALIFAMDESHWMPAVWLANRNALVATVPVLFGLHAHIRWREDGWKPGLVLSVTAYAIGMMGGEAWLGMLAYVGAYELFGRADAFRRRALALVPAGVAALFYVVMYKTLGFGADGSGAYTEPFSSLYMREAPGRMLALLGALLIGSPVDAWGFFPEWRGVLKLAGIAAVLLFGALLLRCRPFVDKTDRQAFTWLIPGGVLSLLPVVAAFPMSRQLLGPSVAASAIVAVLVRYWWDSRRSKPLSLTGVALAVIAVLNVVVAPFVWPVQSILITVARDTADRAYATAPVDDGRVGQQDVFLLAAFDPLTQVYAPIVLRANGRPMPASWHTLSAGSSDHLFTRTAVNAFELESHDGPLVQGFFADFLRAPKRPLDVGDTVRLRQAKVTVLSLRDGKPGKILVECDRPLEDPGLHILVLQDFKLDTFSVPPIGESRPLSYFSARRREGTHGSYSARIETEP